MSGAYFERGPYMANKKAHRNRKESAPLALVLNGVFFVLMFAGIIAFDYELGDPSLSFAFTGYAAKNNAASHAG
jgi:hypothetical protein